MKKKDAETSFALLQTANAVLDQILLLLMRMRSLAEQAAQAVSDEERQALDAEFSCLQQELDALSAEVPDFSGLDLTLLDEEPLTRPLGGKLLH